MNKNTKINTPVDAPEKGIKEGQAVEVKNPLLDTLQGFLNLAANKFTTGLEENELKELQVLDEEIPILESELKTKKDRQRELNDKLDGNVKLEQKLKNQLSRMAEKTLGLDEATLKGIGLEQVPIRTVVKGKKSESMYVRFWLNGNESHHSRKESLSYLSQAASRTVGLEGFKTGDLSTQLELRGIKPEYGWYYRLEGINNKIVDILRYVEGKAIQVQAKTSNEKIAEIKDFLKKNEVEKPEIEVIKE